MSDVQYTQYTNLHVFAEEWRKYKQLEPPLDKETFRKNMQFEQHVKLLYLNPDTNRQVLIYLLSENSKYAANSQDLKRLLTKIKNPGDVIIVSKAPLKTYAMRAISRFKHLKVKTYLHENFALIIPNGPLCYSHRILKKEEVDRLLNDDLCCYLVNIPRILEEDVQCIWIGAETGDVLEVKMVSNIAGESIHYKVVIPKSGRITSFRTDKKADEKKDVIDDEDEDVLEHREDARAEDDNDGASDDEAVHDATDDGGSGDDTNDNDADYTDE